MPDRPESDTHAAIMRRILEATGSSSHLDLARELGVRLSSIAAACRDCYVPSS